MGKKPHPPRNAGGPKKTSNAVPDSDHIVFTNDNSKPRKSANKPGTSGNPAATPATAAGGPGKPSSGPASNAEQAQLRGAEVRKIIGGASWTGKLPQTLLSEHCQKQQWSKPEFSMKQVPGGGFQSAVTLSSKNPKTGETTTLPPFRFPPEEGDLSTEPTALEARHFAATWALYRISSMKNIHMMLPPKYRDLWKGPFERIKKDDVAAGLGWMYAADPFVAQFEKEAAKAEAAKKREALEKQKAKAAAEAQSAIPLTAPGPARKPLSRAWQNAMQIEMGSALRSDIEEIAKQKALWNPYGAVLQKDEREKTIQQLVDLGFQSYHAEEALEQCKDREEALEWLLLHVPEDDLPGWAFPENYIAGITFASGNREKEAALRRLAEAGYTADDCQRAYKQSNSNESLAAAILQAELCRLPPPTAQEPLPDGDFDEWEEELGALQSIFDDRFSSTSKSSAVIKLPLSHPSVRQLGIRFTRPPGQYPNVLPIVFVVSPELPVYVRLSATRKALEWARENMLGQPMIFNIVDWFEANMADVIENPGKLRDIALNETIRMPGELNSAMKVGKQARYGNRQHKVGDAENKSIFDSWKIKQTTPQQQKMLQARQSLPAWSVRDAVVDAVNSFQVTIISGETGSGKSTQSVQFILDQMIQNSKGAFANILCTQPRRISALGLADRVSDERCSAVGDEVGYIIRGDSKTSSQTKITFMTTGILLRRLQSSSASGSLDDISHIFVDEVHERSLDTDFLLALLRDALNQNKHLKVVLMSATLDADSFINYFGGSKKVGTASIAGRTFPVQDYYLADVVQMTNFKAPREMIEDEEDSKPVEESLAQLSIGKRIQSLGMGINYDLIAATVQYIDQSLGSKDGAILIFLPGTMEIDKCLYAVSRIPRVHALPLHASLMPSEQKLVFNPAPRGKRKVIAATNVAETSITIEDVVAVIDSGRVKETRYDSENRVVRLEEVWASQAACKQRRGRAGRVRAGTCYKLYTEKLEQEMAPRPQPEIRRVPLEQLCLSVKATDESRDVATFLRHTLTPPEEGAVGIAIELLHQIGALEDGHLTALGRYLALIPADLRCAKLLVYGSIFGCLESCLTIASVLTVKSPFVSPRDKREEAHEARAAFSDGSGDLLADLVAFNEWSERMAAYTNGEIKSWCSSSFLSQQILRDISSTRSQLSTALKDAGLIPTQYRSMVPPPKNSSYPELNRFNDTTSLLRAIIAAALTPQIAHIDFPSKKFAASISGAVELDPEARTIRYFDRPHQVNADAIAAPAASKPAGSSGKAKDSTNNLRLFIHPSSILFSAQTFPSTSAFLAYFNKMSTSKLFIRELTPFNLYTLLLFGSRTTVVPESGGLLVDGGWIKVRGWARIGVLVSRLRILLDDVLRRRVEAPNGAWEKDDLKIVELVRRCVEFDGMDR